MQTKTLLVTLSAVGALWMLAGCDSNDEPDDSNDAGAATGGEAGAGANASGGAGGSSTGGEGGVVECPTECTATGDICFACPPELTNFPLVQRVLANTYGSNSAATVRGEDGAICLQGTPGSSGTLQFMFAPMDPRTRMADVRCDGANLYDRDGLEGVATDLVGLGVTTVQFTVASVPSSGTTPTFVAAADSDTETAECGYMAVFDAQEGLDPVLITEPDPHVSLALDQFVLPSWETIPYQEFDPSQAVLLQFAISDVAGFELCIQSLKFLRDDGSEVVP